MKICTEPQSSILYHPHKLSDPGVTCPHNRSKEDLSAFASRDFEMVNLRCIVSDLSTDPEIYLNQYEKIYELIIY